MAKRFLHDLQFLEKVLDLTSDTLLVIDQENRLTDVMVKTNNPVLNPKSDLIGKNILDIFPQPTSAVIEQELKYCRKTGESSNLNYDLPTDEQMYFFKFVVHKFDEDHLLCQYRDITQRSNMKRRLKSALQAQLEVGKVAMIGHWSYDTERQEFFHTGYSNLRRVNLTEPECTSLAGLLKYVHADDRDGMKEFVHDNTAEYSTFEYRMVLPNLPIAYIRTTKYAKRQENNSWILDGFSQNVSDFIKNRNELEMVLAVVDNAPYSIFACHRDGKMAFANKACRLQNMISPQQDIVHLNVYENLKNFQSKDEWQLFVQKIELASGYLQYRCDIEYPQVDIIGSECSALIIKNGNGEDIYWTIQRDISDQLRYEEQLLRSKQAAEESEKLKSAFISNMNHEIRNPLTAIIGFGNMIADTADPALRKEYANILTANSTQLLRLISDVLEMSQMDAGKIRFDNKPISLKGVLKELSLIFSNMQDIPKLSIDQPKEELIVNLDRGRLMQVLINLINNSIKFTPKTGEVHVGYSQVNDHITFYVKDNGIGIAKEKQRFIFDRFFKINELENGTGLGLAICKGIVEQMNGEISVESEDGMGATFSIKLPINTKHS